MPSTESLIIFLIVPTHGTHAQSKVDIFQRQSVRDKEPLFEHIFGESREKDEKKRNAACGTDIAIGHSSHEDFRIHQSRLTTV